MKKFILMMAMSASINSFAQWNQNTSLNTPICIETGKQIDPRIMEDGVGGAYITWKDYRPTNGLPDIYIQRIDAKGFVKWTVNGVGLCTQTADQSTPSICSDMKGGAIVAWSDWRSNVERDLYAQRVDSNGNIKWTVDGANITDLSNREHSEKITSDGQGGIIIAFEKQINGVWDVWTQRLDSAGNKKWGQGGIQLCSGTGSRRNHRIQKDQNGGAIYSWQDLRNGVDYDIYAQRVDKNGNLLWGATGKPVCAFTGDQINAKIDTDSSKNGAIIAWQDTRNSPDYDIYMQRIDSNGNAVWVNNGIVVCNAAGNQSALDFRTIDKTTETIITWKDNRNGNNDIYAQKINAFGIQQWVTIGVAICTSPHDQVNPNICTNQNDGAIIVWQDSSDLTGWDIKAQNITNAGQVLWGTNGVVVSNAIGEQNGPKNVSDNKGGTIITWQDKRSGVFDIYAHHLFSSGSPNGIETIADENKLQVYPNPANDKLYFNLQNKNEVTSIEIISFIGEKILLIPKENYNQINISSLQSGMYILKIRTNKGESNYKFVKQ